MTMQTVGIREAKANLSKYIQSVRQGHEIILTDRGRPVGKMVPIQPAELSLVNRLHQFEENGIIEPQSNRPGGIPAPISLAGEWAQRMLQKDRGE